MVKLSPFYEVRKNFKLSKYEHILYIFEARDPEISNM